MRPFEGAAHARPLYEPPMSVPLGIEDGRATEDMPEVPALHRCCCRSAADAGPGSRHGHRVVGTGAMTTLSSPASRGQLVTLVAANSDDAVPVYGTSHPVVAWVIRELDDGRCFAYPMVRRTPSAPAEELLWSGEFAFQSQTALLDAVSTEVGR